jgi:hypothetical protein
MTVDGSSVAEGFPHPTLTPIIGEPTHASIKTLKVELSANASSVDSILGNGILGLIRLTITEDAYNERSDIPFIVPENPGPFVRDPTATQHQITAAKEEHAELLRVWKEYQATDKALRQQLLAAVPDIYYQSLRDEDTGYAFVTTLDFIEHLQEEHGQIDPAEVAANDVALRAPFDPAMPIQQLFSRVEACIRLAKAAKAPYTDEHIVATAYNTIYQTGLYNSACRRWQEEDEDDQTWGDFKSFFTKAQKALRRSQATTQSAGYHAANSIVSDRDMATIDALAFLAKAQTSDRTTVSTISSTQEQLTYALTEALNKFTAQTADLQALHTKVHQLENKNNGNGNGNRNGNGNSNGNNKRKQHGKPTVHTTKFFHNNNYCWTHGYHIHDSHTSVSCRFPSTGHQKEATRANTMQGSDKDKNLVM